MTTIINKTGRPLRLGWLPGRPVLPPRGAIRLGQIPPPSPAMAGDIRAGRLSVVMGDRGDARRLTRTPPSVLVKDGPPHRPSATMAGLGIAVGPDGPLPLRLPSSSGARVTDTALVMCHHGHVPARLAASRQALEWTLQSSPMPPAYIVEAARPGEPMHFDNLPGATHIPRAITPRSEGVWLKESLWNIGARQAIGDGFAKLVFLDMDCSFARQDWLVEVSAALDAHDIISPHAYHYYAGQPEGIARGPMPSRGMMASLGLQGGMPGVAVAMTAEFLTGQLGGALPTPPDSSGDTILWLMAAGWGKGHKALMPLPYDLSTFDCRGLSPRPGIGHAGQVIAHHAHGPLADRHYQSRAMVTRACFPEYLTGVERLPDGMPCLPGTPQGRIFRKLYPSIMAGTGKRAARDAYDQAAAEEHGPIDVANPLVVTCLLRSGGIYGPRHVVWLRDQFARHCLAPHRFVCQADTPVEGVEVIPLVTTAREAPWQWAQAEHYRSIWPDNASVLTCDLDTVITRPFLPHRCPDGEIFMLRETGNWHRYARVTWASGLTYFRGDFSQVFEAYMRDTRAGGRRRPQYLHAGSQESIMGSLREIGKYPGNIDSHFCCRYWNGGDLPEEAVFAIFPASPKPWDISPRPSWVPPPP